MDQFQKDKIKYTEKYVKLDIYQSAHTRAMYVKSLTQ